MENPMLILHFICLAFIGFTLMQADYLGFSWIKGKIKILSAEKVTKLHHQMWTGLCMMIITGLTLFLPMREYLLARPEFWLKMFFLTTLIINGIVIGKINTIATITPFNELTVSQKIPLFVSGIISTVAWFGAFTTAFFITEY